MPAEGRGRRKARKSNCSSVKWKDPQWAPTVFLGKHPAAPQGPGCSGLLHRHTQTRGSWAGCATLLSQFHLLFQAPVPQTVGQTEQPGPPPSEHLNAGWPTSPSAS